MNKEHIQNGKTFGKTIYFLSIFQGLRAVSCKLSVNLTLPFSALFSKKHGKTGLITSNRYLYVGKTYNTFQRSFVVSLEGLHPVEFSAVFRVIRKFQTPQNIANFCGSLLSVTAATPRINGDCYD